MKILVVTNSFYPKLSGVAVVVDDLYNLLAKTYPDIKVMILCGHLDKTLETEIYDRITITRYARYSFLEGRVDLPKFDLISKLIDQIKLNRPDQIHVHSRFSTINIIAVLVAKIYKIPVVHYEHLSDFVSGEGFIVNSLSYLYDQIVTRLTYLLVDKIVTVSKSSKQFIQDNFSISSDKISVVENGCTFEPSRLTYKEKFVKDKRLWKIFFAARLVGLKNPIKLIEAAQILAKRRKDFILNIAGDGKLKTDIIDRIKSSSNITYLGRLSKKQMQVEFDCSDIFVNCSMIEGLPSTVLEAIYNTTIPIVSAVGGNVDLVGSPEYQVRQLATPEELADRIEYVMDHYLDLIANLQNNKDYVIKYFTWHRAVKQLKEKILD